MPGGHESHGEVSPDQLFHLRPVPHYTNYRSPVRALCQCGASTHPGGAVSCVPGHNASREIVGQVAHALAAPLASGPGAGATGVACGIVRNFYMTEPLHAIIRHSVDLWMHDPASPFVPRPGPAATLPALAAYSSEA